MAIIQRAWKFSGGTAQLLLYFYPEKHSKDTENQNLKQQQEKKRYLLIGNLREISISSSLC